MAAKKIQPEESLIILFIIFVFMSFPLFPLPELHARPRPEIKRYSPVRLEGEKAEMNFQVKAILTPVWPMAHERDSTLMEAFDPYTFVNATNVEWEIFKPNLYAADSIEMIFFWEGPVKVTFEGVENLTPEVVVVGDVLPIPIPIWYAIREEEWSGEPPVPFDENAIIEGTVIEGEEAIAQLTKEYALQWLSVDQVNNLSISLSPPNEGYITSKRLNIWTKLKVDFGIRSANYADKDGFYITVTASP